MKKLIPVVDLFAGPGGLGEGFSSLKIGNGPSTIYPFRIALSVEKEAFAHRTLKLRAFYRLLILNGAPLSGYYDYISGKAPTPYTRDTKEYWEQAGEEALQLEIGSEIGNKTIHRIVRKISAENKDWILIGGPPCQAYSLVGRARNMGKKDYKAENDHRHFLYKHYLDLIQRFRPSIFVMENVKGILSSKVSGAGIFDRILKDIRADDGKEHPPYRIYSLVNGSCVYSGPEGNAVDPHDFIVRSEQFGIPQARHRVILIGIREDIAPTYFRPLEKKETVTLAEAIRDLPKLRGGLSKKDSWEQWQQVVKRQAQRVLESTRDLTDLADRKRIQNILRQIVKGRLPHSERGGSQVPVTKFTPTTFGKKLRDQRLSFVLNHETRGHMEQDLARYLFAAAYGDAKGASPSQEDFPRALAPRHKNWFSGKFADRFRVQVRNQPSTTVTSHIAKDGNYYIHFDARQCRSLTVREAARLQTFPDNYFFEGSRTEQYVQVGNAVPPLLAQQIAKKIWRLLKE